jgi:beta-xylosidase
MLPLLLLFASTYSNPVLPGDHPDPSVIRVGDEYWATATSSQWAPIFPILRSKNLVDWEQVGAMFEDRPAWSENSYWAPEIAQHGGKIFVYYTARRKGGPLCVAVATAPKPLGPYTDHGPMVCQDAGSIDAVPVTDENGARWLVWKEDGNSRRQPTPLWAQRLSADGTKLVGELHELFRNDAKWEGQLVEGPFIVRRNGWFYMFYSGAGCCGRNCNYALGVARSRKLLGPWEKYGSNPILALNDNWKCPGHGSIVETADGRTFLLYHAYDPRESIYVGRQGLLDEVTWGADGWPAINGGKGPSAQASIPYETNPKTGKSVFLDDFNTPGLRPGWHWPPARRPQAKLAGGWLELAAEPRPGALIARSPVEADYEVTTAFEVAPEAAPGLAAWGNDDNFVTLSFQRGELLLWGRRKGAEHTIATEKIPAARRLHLRMRVSKGHEFRFAYSADGKIWKELGSSVEGSHLPPWDLATRIALTNSGKPGAVARFDFIRVTSGS